MYRIRCHRKEMEYAEPIDNNSGKYRCMTCQYTSNRQYNVTRHEERIHSRKLERSCCGKIFITKGEWYLHCEEFHPTMRATAFVSKEKYKILKHSKRSEKLSTDAGKKMKIRRSARIKESVGKERAMMLMKFDAAVIEELEMEDVPLIYFIQHRELRQKFIEKSYDMYNKHDSTTTSAGNESSDYSDQYSNHSSSLTNSGDENYASDRVFYNEEIVAIETQTVEYMSCSSSELIEAPINLPLKKRILQELRNNSIGQDSQRGLRRMSIYEKENFGWHDKENIHPVSKNLFDMVNVSKKVTVTTAEESVTWNEITKHQRAYLSSVDWECYKLY